MSFLYVSLSNSDRLHVQCHRAWEPAQGQASRALAANDSSLAPSPEEILLNLFLLVALALFLIIVKCVKSVSNQCMWTRNCQLFVSQELYQQTS